MVTLVAVGTLLISAGPSIALWLGLLQRRAHLLVVAILSAFIWCVSITLASVIWLMIPPLKQKFPWILFIAVTSQELGRYGLYLLFRVLGNAQGVEVYIRSGARNGLLTGLAVGVGFAIMSVLIHFYSVLVSEFSDDTAIYILTCPMNFFVAAAAFASAFSIIQILLSMIAWPAYSERDERPLIFIAYLLHLGIGELTLLNRRKDGCRLGMGLIWTVTFLLFIFTFFITRRRLFNESH